MITRALLVTMAASAAIHLLVIILVDGRPGPGGPAPDRTVTLLLPATAEPGTPEAASDAQAPPGEPKPTDASPPTETASPAAPETAPAPPEPAAASAGQTVTATRNRRDTPAPESEPTGQAETDSPPEPPPQSEPLTAERGAARPEPDGEAGNATAPAGAPAQQHAAAEAAADRQAYRSWMRERLSQRLSYPPLARRRGWEEVLRVRLEVTASGSLRHFEFVGDPEYRVLAEAATQALRSIQSDDPFCCLGSSVSLEMEIEFRLR